jgi:hypothetical protein
LIKFRIDVDYPYPSRLRSFAYTILGLNVGKGYLKNSKVIAQMINDSPKEVKAFWFFTPTTIPDKELLKLLTYEKHEVALHVANSPYREWKELERATGRKVRCYTIHGTARLFARIMWKRWLTKTPMIPQGFPLESFHQFPVKGVDIICYRHSTEQALKIIEKGIRDGHVLHIHPIWLFQRGKLNQRGPYYETLKRILKVDGKFGTVAVRKKIFFKIANDAKEYERNVTPNERFLEELKMRGVDLFTFIERKWTGTVSNPSEPWIKTEDNIALLHNTTYDEWWKNIGKKTRNVVRKAEKKGVATTLAEMNERFAEGIWRIYNETPIRQERAFPHYGVSLEAVTKGVLSARNSTFIGAFLQDELIGFVQLVHGDDITIISQILSLQKHRDKAVNNALVAKTVDVCANMHAEWIMYGRIGNHPSLDDFKRNNGFTRFRLKRYYIALTTKGRIATRLGLHKEMKDSLPQSVKYSLIPIYNWISRTKMRIKLYSGRKTGL